MNRYINAYWGEEGSSRTCMYERGRKREGGGLGPHDYREVGEVEVLSRSELVRWRFEMKG